MTCNNAPIEALGDFVMLTWLRDYQTLVSGVLALAAGALVYAAAILQLNASAVAESKRQRNATMTALAAVRSAFTAAQLGFRTNTTANEAEECIGSLRDTIAQLAPFSPTLSDYLLVVANPIGVGLRDLVAPGAQFRWVEKAKHSRIWLGYGYAVVMQHYFQRLDRLIAADGRITIPKKETADRLAKILNDRDLESLKMKLPFVSWIYEIERGT